MEVPPVNLSSSVNLSVGISSINNIIIDESPRNNSSINKTSTSSNNDPFNFISTISLVKLSDTSVPNNITNLINTVNSINLTPDLSNDFNSLDIYNYDSMFAIYSDSVKLNQFGKYLESKYISNSDYISKLTESGNSNLIQTEYKLYFKLTKQSYRSKGYQYHQGLNIDPNPFNPDGWCSGGGFYFCELKDLHQFQNFGEYLTPILVPTNTPIYHEVYGGIYSDIKTHSYNKYKAPMVYTLPRWNLNLLKTKVFFEPWAIGNCKWNSNLFYKSIYSVKSNHSKIHTINNLLYYDNNDIITYPLYYQKEIALNYLIKHINLNPNKNLIPDIITTYSYHGYKDINKYYLKKLIEHKNKNILTWLINKYFPYKIRKQTKWQASSKYFKPISKIDLDVEKYLRMFTKSKQELFTKYCAVIAGSHVVKNIFDNLFYYPNDIDIYISSSLKKQFIEELAKPDSCLKLKRETKDLSFANQYNMTGVDSVYSLIENIIYNSNINEQTFMWNNTSNKYQVIFVNTFQSYDFITDNFDFDICTSSFDFASKKFLINYTKNQGFKNMRIQDSYINKMTGTETDSYSNYRANKTIERMHKYIERGFTIENWKEFLIEIRDKMCKD